MGPTAGTSLSWAWSCRFLSPTLLPNSPASPQRCTIAETPFSAWRLAQLDSLPVCPHTQMGRGHCSRATKVGAHIKRPWSYVPGNGRGQTCSREGHPFVFGAVWPFLSQVGLRGIGEGLCPSIKYKEAGIGKGIWIVCEAILRLALMF